MLCIPWESNAATWFAAANVSDAAVGTGGATVKPSIQAAVDVATSNDAVLLINGICATGGRVAVNNEHNWIQRWNKQDSNNPSSIVAVVSGTESYEGGQTGSAVWVRSSCGGHTVLSIINSVLNLDGANSYMALPSAVWFQGDFTAEAWVYIRRYTRSARLFDFGNGEGSDNVFLSLSEGPESQPACHIFNSSAQTYVVSPQVIPTGVWAHVAFSLSGSIGKMFINGQPVATNNEMNVPHSLTRTNNYIGKSNWDEDAYANAMVDGFTIWSRALSQTEIADTMGREFAGQENGSVGYWNFYEGTAADITTNGNNGILNGGASIITQQVCTSNTYMTYALVDLPKWTNHSITAFLDSNHNQLQDYWEAWGAYSNNPIYLTNDVNGVDIELIDPDHDGDGQLDWIERQNGTDPYNSSSRVVTITGVIAGGVAQPGPIRVVATLTSSDSQLQSTNSMKYSTVATGGWFRIQGVPTLANYWVKGFIDTNANGVWSPVEALGSYAGNPIYLTNDFAGADITMRYGDWDGDGLIDDEEAFAFLTSSSNSLAPIQVDDNGPNDPLPGDPEINDPGENGTRYHPYDAIQKAINVATSGSVIVVMDGTYSGVGNKDIDTKGKAITIRSRYGYNSTTIDVASVHNGFVCFSNETAATVIKGFTIHTWASFFGLSGILCNKASPTIEDCRILDCGVAGILCTNGANPTIRRTVIEANTGGVRCYGSSPVFDRCLVQSNYSGRGAGVLVESNSHPYFVNTLIVGNRSTNDGGGVYIGAGCNPTGINCTVAFNVASNRGSALSTAGTPLFKNVIVWGNSDPANDPIDLQSAATFTYSCVQEFHPGTGNGTNNPVFIAPGDYQLQFTSPCLDVGTSVGAPTNDYAGHVRPMDGDGDGNAVVDIGAYERTNYVYVCTQAFTHYVSAVSTNPKIPYTNWATAAQHIQSAINVAYTGALVLVSNGTYSTGGGVVYGALTNRVAINKAITVRSVNGPTVTLIRGSVPSGDSAVRCAYVGTNALLSGFTLTNGATRGYGASLDQETMGGGAWLEKSGVLSNCVIIGNSAVSGGGGLYGGALNNCTLVGNSVGWGYCSGGGAITSTLNNCTLIGNSAFLGGGAAWCTLNNCTLSNNWVDHPLGGDTGGGGGGAADCVLNSCTVINNHAGGGGGGTADGVLSNCTVVGNSAGVFGGGAEGGTLYNCTLSGNSAESGGGAERSTLYNSILSGNTATAEGGGVYAGTLYNCTLSGNTANTKGGGAYGDEWNTCTLYNCIVFYNDAPSGANHSGATFNYSCTTPSPGGAGNFADEPQFVNVGAGNFRLQSNSICINRGLNQSWMTTSMDLDGNPRLYAGGVVDMGAYEFQGVPTLLHPEVLYDTSFGMVSNRFGFNINWNSGQVVVVDANTNLNTTNWLPIATNTLVGGPWYFIDSKWTNFIGRFYRIRSIP